MMYLSILEEDCVKSQILQNRMRVIEVPAVVHVPLCVLSHDACAESGSG